MSISHHELAGLTSEEAKARLAQYGYNEVSEAKPSALLTLLRKFWAPVPWMLEATIARTVSHLETVILHIVTYLVVIDILLVMALLAFAYVVHIPFLEALPSR